MFDFMSLIFKGLTDPTSAAKMMAQLNISPEEFKSQVNAQAGTMQGQMQPVAPQTQQPDETALNWRQRIQQENQNMGMRTPGKYNLPNLGEIMSPQEPMAQAQATTTPTTGRLPQAGGAVGAVQQQMAMPDPSRFAGAAPATVPPGMPPQGVTAPNMAAQMPVTPPGMDLGGMMQPQQQAIQGPSSLPNAAQQASVGTTSVPTMRSARQFANVDPELRAIISGAATKYGQDPNTLMRIAGVESSFNPKAKNPKSSAGGLFQFINSTASEYGLKDKFDPAQASDAAARLMRDNRAYLVDKLGREPTPGELYLAHQQGKAGAERLLIDPDVRAADIVGSKAITLNGGTPDMTAGQFASLWTSKFDKFGGTSGGGTSVAKGGASSTPTAAGAEAGTEVAQTATPSTTTEPKSKAQTLADKLAEIGKSIQVPEGGAGTEPPLGRPEAPRPGNFNVNPDTIRTMLAMLAPGGAPPIPSLAQLMGGRIGG